MESDLLSPSIEETESTILHLPLELRRYMYDYIFHSLGCNEHGGCHCGDKLSITNRQLYQETRPLVYNYAKPRFLDVESCIRFLRDIKGNTFHVKSLSIIDRELSSQSYRLADVFRYPGIGGLEEFKFIVKPQQTHLDLNSRHRRRRIFRSPPVYSLFEERHSPAVVYDMSLRVSRHPLAALGHLRRLTVEGYPQSDIEEAIFKASRNIEELGRRGGKEVKRWELEKDQSDRFGTDNWIYSIWVVD